MILKEGGQFLSQTGTVLNIIKIESGWIHYTIGSDRYTYRIPYEEAVSYVKAGEVIYTEYRLKQRLIKELINTKR